MNGDDIKGSNTSMPWFPDEMPLWQRISCLFGYHKRETRQSAPGHCYRFQTAEGLRRGIFGIHDEEPMRRAKPLPMREYVELDFHAFTQHRDYVVPVENKQDSFGVLAGKIVAVDYGS